jgi:hypothetical protein
LARLIAICVKVAICFTEKTGGMTAGGDTTKNSPKEGMKDGSRLRSRKSRRLTSPFYKFGMYSCGFLVHPL